MFLVEVKQRTEDAFGGRDGLDRAMWWWSREAWDAMASLRNGMAAPPDEPGSLTLEQMQAISRLASRP